MPRVNAMKLAQQQQNRIYINCEEGPNLTTIILLFHFRVWGLDKTVTGLLVLHLFVDL